MESEIRTVVHLADYFRELRAATDELAASEQATARGYFTPSEDEQIRGILVSYWHSRAALLELIATIRVDQKDRESYDAESFLVAFAAALLLVNAARYLREKFHHQPLVRQKLNEPATHFGIPGGSYDLVQRSLLSTRHAWHLYHAARYFEENEAELRELASLPPLSEIMAIIDRLRGRLEVSVSRYAGARLRFRSSRIWRGVKRRVLFRAIYGLQKVAMSMMAHIRVRPGHRPQLPAAICRDVTALLRPGDVMLVRKEYAITNYFLPGYWPHAAMFIGQRDGQPEVLEAMKDGVLVRGLESPFGADSIVVLRPELAGERVEAALARGLRHEGKPYDFDFDFSRDDRLVCTEVVYRSYEGLDGIEIPLHRRAGRVTLSARDLLDMSLASQVFQPVAAYVAHAGSAVVQGDLAVDLVRRYHQNAVDQIAAPD